MFNGMYLIMTYFMSLRYQSLLVYRDDENNYFQFLFQSQAHGVSSDVIRKVQIQILSQDKCENLKSPKGRTTTIRQLCAGKEKGKDSCSGDSGGPLIYRCLLNIIL